MSLLDKTCKAPIPFEPAFGDEALAAFLDAPAPVRVLIRGTAGCSPYLRGLIRADSEWLRSVLALDPDDVLSSIRKEAANAGAGTLADRLRLAKRRIALYVALADLGGMWTLDEVTGALTDFADFAVQQALGSLIATELERGRLPGCGDADLARSCGMVVLAMGKMGARELNYSSDIDLIVLFDETRIAPEHYETLRARFIRITREMSRLLSGVTAQGYVFRTDLRLRPDPSVTPVCLPIGAAERYYESLGRTWERAAFIKARVCAGDTSAGAAFLDALAPFVWRKHLDFAAIEDAHDMRLRIRKHKGLGGPIVLRGHDMKLGRGGIREIEFFAQTRQIIAGGRDEVLREQGTLAALKALAHKGWISRETADTLSAAYVAHRTVEHRIQMIADAQSHMVPRADRDFSRLASLCGVQDPEEFRQSVVSQLETVHGLIESFFAKQGNAEDSSPKQNAEYQDVFQSWRHYPALRSDRANRIFSRLKPLILKHVGKTPDPDATLQQFGRFLSGLPAGVQLFSLFEATPLLIELLVDICGTAPGLAQYLSKNAQVLDAVIGGEFFEPLPPVGELSQRLKDHLSRYADYESRLDAARRWMKERHFAIGVQHLKGIVASDAAAAHYSTLAEAVLAAILPLVVEEFARRHGVVPAQRVALLAMGSLGAGSLTATSDLDLIVIYDAEAGATSNGKRPLAPSTYFARLTQALVGALNAPMSEGRLYDVDMRLRPSGRKGPVATSWTGFQHYQSKEAWVWEHLALTRARFVAGDAALGARIEALRRAILAQRREKDGVLADVADLRGRIREATDSRRIDDPLETKVGAGRMLDIEILAQTGALLAGSGVHDVVSQLEAGRDMLGLDAQVAHALSVAYRRLSAVRQIACLLGGGRLSPETTGEGARALLKEETGTGDFDRLIETLARERKENAKVIERLIGGGDARGHAR